MSGLAGVDQTKRVMGLEAVKAVLEKSVPLATVPAAARSGVFEPERATGERVQAKGKAEEKAPSVPGISIEELKKALAKLNMMMELTPVRLEFSFNEPTKRMVVKVIDQESGKVLRQIPPEKVLETMQRIMEFIGLLLDEKA